MSFAEEKPGAERGRWVGRRRRRWSEAQKRQIVAETHEQGVSVLMVAQRYNVYANQVFTWRRLFCEPERAAGTGRFVPVVVGTTLGHNVGSATMHPPSDDAIAAGAPAMGHMEIVLAGDRRVIVDRAVNGSNRAACSKRKPSVSWQTTPLRRRSHRSPRVCSAGPAINALSQMWLYVLRSEAKR